MKTLLQRSFDDLSWIFYPKLCAACTRPLYAGEECICTICRFHLPRTQFHLQRENAVEKHFWGKVPLKAATAYYYFSKGEKVQRLIHGLKYKGRQDIGEFVGRLMGVELRDSPFSENELIIPVPLHESKLKIRGYNQSDCFAEGLSQGMNVAFSSTALQRKKQTDTQTRKHRFERFRNVENVFEVKAPSLLENKHILLVDDVVTTGSTLIACAETLLRVPGVRLSFAAMACA
ncbi:MAG: ComF family protein [Bacteroidetes bacterium]|nr:ComF family protein [Bacteroidota bacterium]